MSSGSVAKVLGSPEPIIDQHRLDSIKALGEPDDADGFFQGLLDIFFDRAPKLIEELEEAVKDRDSVRVEKLAHALKGSAGNLGAVRLMVFAERLETLGRARQLEAEAQAIQKDLAPIYALTRDALVKGKSKKSR